MKGAVVLVESAALVLRRVEFGEADFILTLFTEKLGRVSALARGARKSQRRYGGALEPFFTLEVRLEERAGRELMTLTEATLTHPRIALLAELSRLDAAGRALAWIRQAAPARTAEPEVWRLAERLLDRLAEPTATPNPERELAETGLCLLAAFGWGIDLERCVSCGRPCPETARGSVDPARGGLVCRNCGGGRLHLGSASRKRLARAAAGDSDALQDDDVQAALDLIGRTFSAHAGVE